MALNRLDSQALALRALGFIAADPDMMGAFMDQCGADIATVRARAGDPEFLGFVLDHLLSGDEAVLAFAAAEGIDPLDVQRARMALPGGDNPEWT